MTSLWMILSRSNCNTLLVFEPGTSGSSVQHSTTVLPGILVPTSDYCEVFKPSEAFVVGYYFISFDTFDIVFVHPCRIPCSMDLQHLRHTLDLAKSAFLTYQFLAGRFP